MIKKPKKQVRRVYFQQDHDFHTTQQNEEIFVADNKCTLMGYDLHIIVSSASGGGAGFCQWEIYRTKTSVPGTNSAAAQNDQEVSDDTVVRRREITPGGVSIYAYQIKSKGKRKLSKGEVLTLQFKAAAIDAANIIAISGILYIGE